MAFNIVLQTNTSENIKVDKTLTDISTLSGTLRADTSIIDPVLIIEADLTTLVSCNYLTIESFGRSYFVTDIRSLLNGLIQLTCHCDVISSFKDEIRNNNAILKRSENDWNLYVDDGVFRTYQNSMIVTKSFSSGFTAHEFVLAVAGA